MKVLLCHNYYQQPGGEDQSFLAEGRLLEANGHEVFRYTVHNDALKQASLLGAARRTLWNRQTHDAIRSLLRKHRPAVMHCTNTFPLLSPAVYYAARREGVAVVQSLRNYRLLCPAATFHRDGRVCESCLGKTVPWPGVLHGCYRGSRAATAVVSALVSGHRLLRTWTQAVDQYFTLTHFARQKFLEGGFPADRLHVKPNFVDPDPGPGSGTGGFAIFVGRLSPEKGVATLLEAWQYLGGDIPLKIVGDGPLRDQVRQAATPESSIHWLGRRPTEEVLALLGEAAFLVMPSTWYETFGRTIIEAFSRATPVIASRLGAMAELVQDHRNGRLFTVGDAVDLAATVRQLWTDSALRTALRQTARQSYLHKYTGARNYEILLNIYQQALSRSRRTPRGCQWH
jgi:glycosyltransferase involved in cell wall biosynthesis